MNGDWFRHLGETGRLPLFWFFAGVIVGFLFIRLSVRLIRAQVKWWPGNVQPGGLHIHHAVFGIIFMMIGGVAGLAITDEHNAWQSVCAAIFGVGSALVLDEFALILHLDDVYWQASGRTSIDAIFVAVALTGLLVLGIRPVAISDIMTAHNEGLPWAVGVVLGSFHLCLAMIALLKGKIWTGLAGLFIPVLLYVGAWRLARPGSPWARWRYKNSPRKMSRAESREIRFRQPMIRGKIWVQDFLAGRPDQPPPSAPPAPPSPSVPPDQPPDQSSRPAPPGS
jgi:hypothetical protein